MDVLLLSAKLYVANFAIYVFSKVIYQVIQIIFLEIMCPLIN